MNPEELYHRYLDLQAYAGWTEADRRRVQSAAPLLTEHLDGLIEDFYEEVERHPKARQVITGGAEQISRLKRTLREWLVQLLSGPYDGEYVSRRWRVGWRHVEIRLDQVYTNVALSRLRTGLHRLLREHWAGGADELHATMGALDKLLDLDLAIIEDAYQTEYMTRLQNTERLATMGKVAGGVAHELRNPLNVVKTSVYYLLNARNPTAEKTLEHLRRIEKQVTAADSVITALTNFARLPVPDVKPFAVAHCLQEVLELYPLPETVQIRQELPVTLPPALADVNQVRIVFANLVRNAREAMAAGGQLTLQARARDGHVEVSVGDTGVGMTAEQLSRVTEPLYTTKARGLGLGLAISKAILEKNQGQLAVQSEFGNGSTFTVRLPAAPPPEEGGA